MVGRKEELLTQAEAKVVNRHNAKFAGMEIDGPVFRYAGREYPINTISAEIVVGAQKGKSRTTATRVIGGGLVAGPGGMLLGGAAKKRTDTSKVYISVKLGDGSVHTVSKPANAEGQLRLFADTLESAVNRKWPLTTQLGTTIELDRKSVRPKQSDALGWIFLLGGLALAIVLAFTIKWWAVAVGIGVLAASHARDVHKRNALHREFDEHFPGWREKGDQAERTNDEQLWDQARKRARESHDG